jgi:hypothetical protein
MAGNHAMNLLGVVPVALSMGEDIKNGDVKGAVMTGSSFAAITAAPTVIAKVATLTKFAPVAKVAGLVGGKAIPIVGSAFGAVQSVIEAHQDFTTGHVARGWLDTVKAGAYGTAAVAGVATAADCWNPTVIAPALVTVGALAVGASIDAGEALYAHRQGIVNGAKNMWNWATGGSGQTAQQAVPEQAHKETPDPTKLPTNRMGGSAAGRLKGLAPDTSTTTQADLAHERPSADTVRIQNSTLPTAQPSKDATGTTPRTRAPQIAMFPNM